MAEIPRPGNFKASLLDRLASGETLISDGATWTYLESHGLEPGECPEELNVSNPELVRRMARDYFAAGSDMVLTHSFAGTRYMLDKYELGHRASEFNYQAAQHARSQAPPGSYVLGSVGPTGQFLAPIGRAVEPDILESFAEQIAALEAGGADGVVIETMVSLEEAVLAIAAAKQSTGLVVMATMVFDRTSQGFQTIMGVTPSRAVGELLEAGADVVGANCGSGIEVMVELASELRAATDGYLLVHCNAGIPSIRDAQIYYPESPEYMEEGFKRLVEAGINIIGGCCGTGPDHIRTIKRLLRG